MVALVMAGFVVLSTFVPTINACNMVLALVHLTLFLFLTSELLIHLDFYSAIVRPFWHEESIASNENAVTFVVALAGLVYFKIMQLFVYIFREIDFTKKILFSISRNF